MSRRLTDLAGISVDRLNGVGPKKQEALASIDVTTVLDLLMYYPRRYIDRTEQMSIDELVPGDEAMVLATVEKSTARRMRTGKMLVEVKVSDGSGLLYMTFFNQPWRTKQLAVDAQAVFFGKVDLYKG